MDYSLSTDSNNAAKAKKKTVVDTVVDYILDKVATHEWQPGTKIPTEFELVEALNVSRNSVREASKVLVALGLLEIRRADGTYVVNHFSEKMMNPWACSLLLEDDDSLTMLEMRMVIERGIFSLAIQKGTAEDMKSIYAASESFVSFVENTELSPLAILTSDLEYREKICAASHNPLMMRLNSLIAYATWHSRKRSIENAISCDDTHHMIDSHRVLTDTIVKRQAEKLDDVLNYCYKYWDMALQDEQ